VEINFLEAVKKHYMLDDEAGQAAKPALLPMGTPAYYCYNRPTVKNTAFFTWQIKSSGR
jgi:hypothetical protein